MIDVVESREGENLTFVEICIPQAFIFHQGKLQDHLSRACHQLTEISTCALSLQESERGSVCHIELYAYYDIALHF